jgi:hypothetical protein
MLRSCCWVLAGDRIEQMELGFVSSDVGASGRTQSESESSCEEEESSSDMSEWSTRRR